MSNLSFLSYELLPDFLLYNGPVFREDVTFTEEVAKSLIGTKFPGSIHRVQKDPYDYVIPETGEVIKLSHSYEYRPEGTGAVFNEPLKLVA